MDTIELMVKGVDLEAMKKKNKDVYFKLIQAECFAQWKLGNYTGAIKSFEEQLVLMEGHQDIYAIYENMALTYNTMGDLDKATEFYAKAREGIEGDKLASNYLGVGVILTKQKKFDEAIETMQIAEEIYKRGDDTTILAKAQKAIGGAYKQSNDLENAEVYYRKSMGNFVGDNPDDSPLLASIFEDLAYCIIDQGDDHMKEHMKEVEDLLYKGLVIRGVQDKFEMMEAYTVTTTISNRLLSMCENCKERFEAPLKNLLVKVNDPSTDIDVASAGLFNILMGQFMIHSSKIVEALPFYETGVKLFKQWPNQQEIQGQLQDAEGILNLLKSMPAAMTGDAKDDTNSEYVAEDSIEGKDSCDGDCAENDSSSKDQKSEL